jgi:uncharacterized protein YqeY
VSTRAAGARRAGGAVFSSAGGGRNLRRRRRFHIGYDDGSRSAMKNVLVPVLSALLASALTAVALELTRDSRGAGATGAEGAIAPPVAMAPPAEVEAAPSELAPPIAGATLARLAAVEERLDQLEARAAGRQALVPEKTQAAAPLLDDEGARAFILGVLEDERRARDEERLSIQRERLAAGLRSRIDRTAEALELSPEEADAVFDVYQASVARRGEVFETMREGGRDPGAREWVREEMQRIEEWKTQELERELGGELARQVMVLEDGRMSGFPRELWRGRLEGRSMGPERP